MLEHTLKMLLIVYSASNSVSPRCYAKVTGANSYKTLIDFSNKIFYNLEK
ncbi:MAG: hypothetical protein KBA66_21805 [Leptospiraceae bacterium]|nr:hypothetical protein [Leptospiraceae bacterium]